MAADAEIGVVVIDQLVQLTGIRAAKTFFEPLQLHLEPADLLEQLSPLGLPLLLFLGLLTPDEQLAGSIEQLPLTLAHLDWVAAQGALHGATPLAWSAAISCIVLRPLITSMATLALNSGLWVRRSLIGGSHIQGWCPASEVNDGGCPEKPDHLT